MRVYCLFFFCFFSPRGDRIDSVVLKCRERAHSNEIKSSSYLFKQPKKLEGPYAPSHPHFSPESPDQNSEVVILFIIVEKTYNYAFGDDLLPRRPRGRGCKLQTLTCVSSSSW